MTTSFNKNNNKPKNRTPAARRTPPGNRRIGQRQSAPVATSRRITTGKPNVRANATHATISHREYVGDVSGSIAFSASQYALNPGNSAVFPWLSSIAMNYESYVFKQLHFHFETSVSTTTAGTVMLAVDYDASDAPPATKQVLMGYAQAQRSAPWQECAFNCRAGDLRKFATERYVRGLTLPSGDVKTYDVGNLFLATQANVSDDIIGELYVSYTVELRTPQIHSTTPPVRSLTMTRGSTDSSFTGGITAVFQPGSDLQPSATATGISLGNMVVGNHYCMTYYTAASGMSLMFFNVFTGATQVTMRYSTTAVPQANVMITFVATDTTVGIEPNPGIAGTYTITELVITECAPLP
jgi:hypothetical protein